MERHSDLNEQQRRAVEFGDGPVLVIAGPGTGKTKTLTARIAYLLEQGLAESSQILALTFTKKSAEEMAGRVAVLIGKKRAPLITTFHGLCHELLGGEMDLIAEPQRLQLIKSLPRPASLKHLSVRELGLLISRAKNALQQANPDIAKVVKAYNKALHSQELHDFDDLLCDAHTLLKEDETVRVAAQERFAYIFVDEFQDTNYLQFELLKLLRGNDNLFVIGDPNQSIYGFRGASSTIFKAFKDDFPAATEITLDTNYRSSPEVVRLSNAIFADQPQLQAYQKRSGIVRTVQVLNEYGEAEWVLREIQKAIGGSDFLRAVSDDDRRSHRRLADFAVMYRSRSAATAVQKAIAESALPYQVVGEGSPYEKPQVQAVISLLRSAATGEDPKLEGFSANQTRRLFELLNPSENTVPSALAERIITTLGLETGQELSQLVATLVRFETLEAALCYFDDIAEQGFYDPKADAITLLTIHAAKGLEFPFVFLVGSEEGILPSARGDIDEERRLFYVAVTRAKERLEVTHARNRGGQPSHISRFISDISAEILPRHLDPDIDEQMRRIAKRTAKRSQQQLF